VVRNKGVVASDVADCRRFPGLKGGVKNALDGAVRFSWGCGVSDDSKFSDAVERSPAQGDFFETGPLNGGVRPEGGDTGVGAGAGKGVRDRGGEGMADRPRGLDVVLVPGARETLSKAQQAFQRLVRRIEKLRASIEKETARCHASLEAYLSEIRPMELELGQERKELVRLLNQALSLKAVRAARLVPQVRDFLVDHLEELAAQFGNELEEDLQRLLKELSGRTTQDLEREDFEFAREMMEEELRSAGVKADLSGLRPDMSSEDLMREFERLEAEMREKAGASGAGPGAKPPNGRRKTKRQLEREEREKAEAELQKRDIGGLYRQLAKLLHPDLEQDPVARAEKEAAMKQLTTAYKANDLHAMLRLEVTWIAREEADPSRLTDAKLAIYNKVLKEQVAELEERLATVALQPRFQALSRYLDPFGLGRLRFDLGTERAKLRLILNGMRESNRKLRGPEAAKEVRNLMEQRRAAQRGVFDFIIPD